LHEVNLLSRGGDILKRINKTYEFGAALLFLTNFIAQ
jgi:hypothetical protein